ncbi:hypothetical protein CSC18_3105 [Klebsiella aerogenes]|nr:hypothetical protein CSC18_3105 [Klebsiella aerogenes]
MSERYSFAGRFICCKALSLNQQQYRRESTVGSVIYDTIAR